MPVQKALLKVLQDGISLGTADIPPIVLGYLVENLRHTLNNCSGFLVQADIGPRGVWVAPPASVGGGRSGGIRRIGREQGYWGGNVGADIAQMKLVPPHRQAFTFSRLLFQFLARHHPVTIGKVIEASRSDVRPGLPRPTPNLLPRPTPNFLTFEKSIDRSESSATVATAVNSAIPPSFRLQDRHQQPTTADPEISGFTYNTHGIDSRSHVTGCKSNPMMDHPSASAVGAVDGASVAQEQVQASGNGEYDEAMMAIEDDVEPPGLE